MNNTYVASDLSFARGLSKTFGLMSLGLLITALTAYFVANSLTLINFTVNFMWVLLLVQLGLAFSLSGFLSRLSPYVALGLFFLYSVVTGFVFSVLFLAYTYTSLGIVFGITAVVFASMAAIGYTTPHNLLKFSTYFFVGLIAIMLITLLNIFLRMPTLQLIVTYAGVILFMGLTAYDVQRLKIMYQEMESDGNLNVFMIFGAFQLYLDFINMFIYILRIFGARRD